MSPWVFIVWLGIAPYSHGVGTQEITEAAVCTLSVVLFWSEAYVRLCVNIDIFDTLSMVICVSFNW